MKEVTVKLYQFDELSDKAKEKARDWWRELEAQDFDPDYDDFEAVAKILGIEFARAQIGKKKDGSPIYSPDIRWSGFSSQGDGASFAGTYQHAKGCIKAIKSYAPKDKELHRIAQELTDLQKKYGYSLAATVTQSGHYYHQYTMDLEMSDYGEGVKQEDYDALRDLLRDFAGWIYKALEEEYDYRMSDENVDESIRANEYWFRENGKRSDG